MSYYWLADDLLMMWFTDGVYGSDGYFLDDYIKGNVIDTFSKDYKG